MSNTSRREFLHKSLALGASATAGAALSGVALAGEKPDRQLEVAAIRFATMARVGDPTYGHTGSKVIEIAESLKTTIMLLKDGDLRICIIATDSYSNSLIVNRYLRDVVAKQLDIPQDHVMVFSSHNHSVPKIASGDTPAFRYYDPSNGLSQDQYGTAGDKSSGFNLYPFGVKLAGQLRDAAKRLPDMLEPVTVWHAEGTEGRITYNRKGRRADGSTYFMREEDRRLVGNDFNGDIDRQAPVIVFKNASGRSVAALVQFTGHPVTSYHPEKLVVCGDWPQTATDIVGRKLADGGEPIPVGFLQGCAGDVNSKEMLCGGVERARQFGRMLGESYTKALQKLKPSARPGMGYAVEAVPVPLAPLPSEETLRVEIAQMRDFIQRAKAEDEDTLGCVGLNFPRALSPKYRGKLIELIMPWSEWALELQRTGRADTVMKTLDLPIHVLRLGDVGIVGMPCEPLLGIGRRIRRLSPLPMTIPCGYTNGSHGYITDSSNTGDREYMSSFYRYTRFRPPLCKPAGDVLADRAAEILKRLDSNPK